MLPDGRAIGLASSYIGDMHHLSLFISSRIIFNGLFAHEFGRIN
jgi:hypothetical protein